MKMRIAKKLLKLFVNGQRMKFSIDMDAQGVELHMFNLNISV